MEIDALHMSSSDDEVYDSGSDSEGFASGEMPKLQFRYTIVYHMEFLWKLFLEFYDTNVNIHEYSRKDRSKVCWIEEIGMGEVLERKGKMWNTTGIIRSGKTYCSIEETLYLAEIGALEILNVDNTSLSLSDMYQKLAEDKDKYGCSWESFEVYRHLKFLGYIVGRHGVAWSMKNVNNKTNAQGMEESGSTTDRGSVDDSFITEMFGNLHLGGARPIFDVFLPNSMFKKTSPSNPSFMLCQASGYPPSKQEIEHLETCGGGIPIKFYVVEHGRVSLLSFTKVELPVLP